MKTTLLTILSLWLAASALPQISGKTPTKTYNIGFFEGGPYPAHTEIRDHFRQQLTVLAPEGTDVVYVPQGFKSAEWNREESRRMAAELTADTTIDMVLALGPWTVEDLLAAGFDRPIIAAYRFDPKMEGLLDSTNRPIPENLTLRYSPQKIETDLSKIVRLKKIDTLAFLLFPSNDEQDKVLAEVQRLGGTFGFSVITAEAYDNDSAYAYFKAYGRLSERADALYVGPLWGLDASQLTQFYEAAGRDHVPVISSEGEYQAFKGALAACSGESLRVTARYAAWKAMRIMQGAIPADLPVNFPEQSGLTINQVASRYFEVSIDHQLRLVAQVVRTAPPGDAETFALTEAVNRALVQNPGFLSRYDALEAAAQAAGQARAAYLPSLKAEASAFYYDNNTVHNDNRFDNARYQAGLTLDQELLSVGAIRDIQLAANQRDQRGAELRRAGLDLEYGVTVAFVNYARASTLYDIRAAHRRMADECRQIAKAKEELGEVKNDDLVRWEDEYLQTTRDLEAADHDLKVARILFNTLLGRPGETQIGLEITGVDGSSVTQLRTVLYSILDHDSSSENLREYLAGESMTHNPEYELSDLAVTGQHVRLSRNSADFLPRIGFRASLNLVDQRQDTEVFQEEHTTWSAGARLELPLFLGGGRFKEKHKLRAELSQLENLRDETILRVASRIGVELDQLQSLTAQLYLSVSSARLAQQYVQSVIDQYDDGTRDISDLLDAVTNDRRARIRVASDQAAYYRSAAALVRELGWSVHDSGQPPDRMLLERLEPKARLWRQQP